MSTLERNGHWQMEQELFKVKMVGSADFVRLVWLVDGLGLLVGEFYLFAVCHHFGGDSCLIHLWLYNKAGILLEASSPRFAGLVIPALTWCGFIEPA